MAQLTSLSCCSVAATCRACGWPANEPPGACAQADCGLRLEIHAARNATRARLGLLPLPAPAAAETADIATRLVRMAALLAGGVAPAPADMEAALRDAAASILNLRGQLPAIRAADRFPTGPPDG